MQELEKRLEKKLQEYVSIIAEEYHEYIPESKKRFLKSITSFEKCISISDTGTISLFYRNNKIYLPKLAFLVLEQLKEHEQYGFDPNHKCYNEETIISNSNTFLDYINHAILKGLTPEEYYQENLLHEAMHFCGCGGANPLLEGITELKTRELAKKKGLITSGCGYPKEVEVVLRLQKIFGEKLINTIVFSDRTLSETVEAISGNEIASLYRTINVKMSESSYQYLTAKFDGKDAHIKKAQLYNKIDYSSVHELLDQYELNQMLSGKINLENEKGDVK